jgi:hypothetical protein
LIATFIMREVRDFVADCGKGTQMELFLTGGRHFSLPPETFWELDQELPDFRDFLNDFWSRQWNFTHRALEAWSRGEIYDGPTTVRHQKMRRELKFKPSIPETSKPEP